MNDTMIGVDLAKSVFQLHGASMTGQLKYRKKLTRSQFRKFMADQPPSVVVIVNERLKVTRFQRLILTRLLGAKAPRRTALI